MSRRQGNGLAGLRVSSDAKWTVTQDKATEAPDLDSATGGQGLTHVLKNYGDGKLNVSVWKMRLMASKNLNKFGFYHRASGR